MNTTFDELRLHFEIERKQVADRLEQLETSLHHGEEQPGVTMFHKWDEGAMKSYDDNRDFAIETRLAERLKELDRVLNKLDSGSYGYCDNCGRPIDAARLEALPQASLCIDCKSLRKVPAKVACLS